MRWQRITGVTLFCVFVGLTLTIVLMGSSVLLIGVNAGYSQTTTDNIIVIENAHQGTNQWQIDPGKEASIEIQAYANAVSVQEGQTLTFYVSTQKAGTPYSIDVYRLGWYGGTGGRLMSTLGRFVGQAQGYYDANTHQLVGCLSCLVDKKTGLVEAKWQPSLTIKVPPHWITGVYLAKFTEVHSMQTYVPFVVRGNNTSRYLIATSDTTYAAYNDWGGYSLYGAGNVVHLDESASQPRAVKVSFDRPYAQGVGASQVLPLEANAIHWLERQGYDLSYISNVDLHKYPKQLLRHRAYISLGHDEYWTIDMRYALARARDYGISLAFLGAGDGYWQMRFEADSQGTTFRTVVCYKVGTKSKDLVLDPFYGKDNTRVTARWRDPLLSLPENGVIGVMYENAIHQQPGFPWQVDTAANSPLLHDTGLQAGQSYGCGLVGSEWDRVFTNDVAPAGLQILGTSQTRDDNDKPDISNTTYYIAPSGAMVFATGSTYWTTALDAYRFHPQGPCTVKSSVVPGIQLLMAHVMGALTTHHPLMQLTFTAAIVV